MKTKQQMSSPSVAENITTRDWWCEQQLFYSGNDKIIVAEPLAASTGFLMLCVFLV